MNGNEIEIGVAWQEILDDGQNPVVETKDSWFYKLTPGTVFHPARGEDPYTT
jgi:hypothetical protein